MSLSERGISIGASKNRLVRVGERLSDHKFKSATTSLALSACLFVNFAATKPVQEQALYVGLMAALGALADIVSREDARSLKDTPKNIGQ